jgi:two-component system, NtrC family, response regulator HupR/HoxA
MINWNEFEHIHVIKKLKHVLQTWWNIDIVFTDERGQLKGFDADKVSYVSPAVNYLVHKESVQSNLAEMTGAVP